MMEILHRPTYQLDVEKVVGFLLFILTKESCGYVTHDYADIRLVGCSVAFFVALLQAITHG